MPNDNPLDQIKQYLLHPTVLIVVGTTFMAIMLFVVNAKLVSPVDRKVEKNKDQIERHVEECDKQFAEIKETLDEIRKDQKDYQEKTMDDMEKMFMYNKGEFDKIYNVLINRNN